MKRREFIAGLAGAAVAWPAAVRAQQPSPMRKLGILSGAAESDPNTRTWISAFDVELRGRGWNEGQNIRIERRYSPSDIKGIQTYAKELVALQPDLIFATNTPSTAALMEETRTIPILFANVSDPVGSGFVTSLASPGRNATGFSNVEPAMGGKWLELLKKYLAPDIKRVAIIFNPEFAPYWEGYVRSLQLAASYFEVKPIPCPVHDIDQLEAVMIAQAQDPGGSVVVIADSFTVRNREQIILLSARYRLPAIYPYRVFAVDGGLMVYGADVSDSYRRAASYADRILRGSKPGELPVQPPDKFELVLNLKTAKALGLDISPTLLAIANEVIE
jgi:putative tryptophan/tyrosine transport system substrate-binding protein